MNRRAHKKSRKGCLQCKSRHIKCDESYPECVNCKTADHTCSYKPITTPTSSVTTPESLTRSNPQTPLGLSLQLETTSLPQPYVNFTHLELFQHIHGDRSFLWEDKSRGYSPHVLKNAFVAPFLMYELLACAALHLSITRPDKFQFYHDESRLLQEQSLKMFKESVPEVNEQNLIPAFLYSGILALHFFVDAFTVPDSDMSQFIDRLVQAINLMRGVRVCFTGWWELLIQSEIRDLMQFGDGDMDHTDEYVENILSLQTKLSEISGIEKTELEVLQEAVRQLKWVYTSSLFNLENGNPSPRMVTSWPITLSVEYTELLTQRRPGSLVVLAYFSVMLHKCRESWAVGSAGNFLLDVVGTYLGEEWGPWLEWPRSKVLEGV